MLVLRRRLGDRSWVRVSHKSGDAIWICVMPHDTAERQVMLGFEDQDHNFAIVREEVLDRPPRPRQATEPDHR